MKKIVAVVYVLFVLAMGTMFTWGFIDKQAKEYATPAGINTDSGAGQTGSNNSNAETSTTPPISESKTYSRADVALHKSYKDCWLIINSNIYDITAYTDQHPGGADLILMYCGKDATSAYNTKGGRRSGHSSRADSILSSYRIGTIK
ncbi:MAG: cytochrome b5-like heme/steroid binding domain-containing protein [Candidatus Saccharibacteria bacterium]